jgi:tRNA-2-methylthio-N6-dimethylallyladenosine synthase
MPQRNVYLETFGCQMNELDSELVVGALRRLGYQFTQEPGEASIILYNTCSVRENAEQKVWSRLGDLAKHKREGETAAADRVVGVLGCLAERDGEDLIRRMPVVDILCGPGELDRLPELLDNALRTKASLGTSVLRTDSDGGSALRADSDGGSALRADSSGTSSLRIDSSSLPSQIALQGNASRRSGTLAAAEDRLELLDLSRAVSPIDHHGTAYVRITRGCNKFCTYCVVPFTRGAEIHRPPEHIIDECRRLADAGAVEVTLLGQTVNHYRFEHGAAVRVNGLIQPQKGRSYKGGHDRDPFSTNGSANGSARVTTFADLLHEIHERVPAIKRLRFVTSYPRDFGNDVLEVMRDHERICRYLHVPGQSGSDSVLLRMNRGYTAGEYMDFLDRARQYLDEPDKGRPLMLSGDIIVGFPGETDADFAKTVAMVERARYKNCFIFKYSPRPGTSAYEKIPDDVPEMVKRRRNNELLAVQATISDAISREQVGRTFDVYIEGLSKRTLKAGGLSKSQVRKAGQVAITIGGRDVDADYPDTNQADIPQNASRAVPGTPPPPPETVQLSGRTDGDLIVFIDTHASDAPDLIGSIVPVKITSADRLSLHGVLV